jgi:hypothetical protein
MVEANEDGESIGGAVVGDEPARGFRNYAYQIFLSILEYSRKRQK